MFKIGAMTRPLDLTFVRRQFPALAGDWLYFDNAGGSQALARVVERIGEFLLTSNVQLGASYGVSQLATERVKQARKRLAIYLNAGDPDEIVFGSSTTQLLSNLALSMAPLLGAGDEIIVTNCDHESNIGPWLRLAEARGAVVRTWKVNPETWELDLGDLEALLCERTRLVCFTWASNLLGTINPVAEIARLVHRYGAKVCVDAVAYAPHRALDMQATGIDYCVFSLYKVYGPHTAVLYGRREHLLELAAINHYFIGKDEIPYKLQPGNANFELAWGSTGIVDYFEELAVLHPQAGGNTGDQLRCAFEPIALHEEVLAERLLGYLRIKPKVHIVGKAVADRQLRVPTVSFSVQDRHASEIPNHTDPFKIGIRWGDFYARRLVESLGLADSGGVVRISMVHYNTVAEVDRLIEKLETIL